jgi:uncharacterized protein (DUF58 family)
MIGVRQAATARLTRWSARRHGRDRLPLTVDRRRIYIVPSRFGIALALLLVAMLIAGLNYNSNLALAFGFLMVSLALVAMHHCHRNLLGLEVDLTAEANGFAGGTAAFEFRLRNAAALERCDLEIRLGEAAATTTGVAARSYQSALVQLPAARRGVRRLERFELRTRYPFGWFRAWTYVQVPLTAFVAPRPHGEQALPAAAGLAGSAAAAEVRGEEDFSGLRAYEAGMPLKHMAWKVVARGADPAVRTYSGTAARPQWLDWAALGRLGTEARLSQLCRWIIDSEAEHRPYGLRLPGIEIAPSQGAAHRTACLRALAAFPADGPGPGAPPTADGV